MELYSTMKLINMYFCSRNIFVFKWTINWERQENLSVPYMDRAHYVNLIVLLVLCVNCSYGYIVT